MKLNKKGFAPAILLGIIAVASLVVVISARHGQMCTDSHKTSAK